jgi:hypothetical protein
MSGGGRRERQAKNEALFRTLNERIRAVTAMLAVDTIVDAEVPEGYVCECADPTCMERVTLTREEYEAVRSSPTQFVVAPGHVEPEIEVVVTRTDRFVVVRKCAGERERAIATDPRS